MKRVLLRRLLGLCGATVAAAAFTATAQAVEERYGNSLATGDFNNDNHPDLLIGIPGAANGRGAVHVLYGSTNGLTLTQAYWAPSDAGWSNAGRRVAAANINNDDWDDVVFTEESATQTRVQVCFGRSWGIDFPNCIRPIISQSSPAAMVIGDFDDGSFKDIAVGFPSATVNGAVQAGKVVLLHWNYMNSPGQIVFDQNTPGVPDVPEAYDRFGSALAAADFDFDGRQDLAVGSTGENTGVGYANGAVFVIYGGFVELNYGPPRPPQMFHTGGGGLPGVSHGLGDSFATANIGWDSCPDLAIGAPNTTVAGHLEAGALFLMQADCGAGIVTAGSQVINRDTAGIPGVSQDWARFGQHLAAGYINGDGYAELATSGDYGSNESILIIRGSATGLNPSAGTQRFDLDTPGVPGVGDMCDLSRTDPLDYGDSRPNLLLAPLNTGFNRDLVIGSPYHNYMPYSGPQRRGIVNVLYGTNDGLTTANAGVFALASSPEFLQ